MIIWSESVKKEKNAMKIYENFTVNPKNCKENFFINVRYN